MLELACGVLRRNGSLLLARRPAGGLFAGLWGPPSAEVRPGDDARAALARALGRRIAVGEEIAACERTLTHRTLTMRAFACDARGEVATGGAMRWVAPAKLPSLGVPSAFRALLARV